MAKCGPKGPSKWTKEAMEQAADKLLKWMLSDHTNLFYKKFAHEVYQTSWQAVYQACKENKRFSYAYTQVKEIQESRLAEAGLNGELNPRMTEFTLKNVSGWRDKKEVDNTHNFPQKIKIELVDP